MGNARFNQDFAAKLKRYVATAQRYTAPLEHLPLPYSVYAERQAQLALTLKNAIDEINIAAQTANNINDADSSFKKNAFLQKAEQIAEEIRHIDEMALHLKAVQERRSEKAPKISVKVKEAMKKDFDVIVSQSFRVLEDYKKYLNPNADANIRNNFTDEELVSIRLNALKKCLARETALRAYYLKVKTKQRKQEAEQIYLRFRNDLNKLLKEFTGYDNEHALAPSQLNQAMQSSLDKLSSTPKQDSLQIQDATPLTLDDVFIDPSNPQFDVADAEPLALDEVFVNPEHAPHHFEIQDATPLNDIDGFFTNLHAAKKNAAAADKAIKPTDYQTHTLTKAEFTQMRKNLRGNHYEKLIAFYQDRAEQLAHTLSGESALNIVKTKSQALSKDLQAFANAAAATSEESQKARTLFAKLTPIQNVFMQDKIVSYSDYANTGTRKQALDFIEKLKVATPKQSATVVASTSPAFTEKFDEANPNHQVRYTQTAIKAKSDSGKGVEVNVCAIQSNRANNQEEVFTSELYFDAKKIALVKDEKALLLAAKLVEDFMAAKPKNDNKIMHIIGLPKHLTKAIMLYCEIKNYAYAKTDIKLSKTEIKAAEKALMAALNKDTKHSQAHARYFKAAAMPEKAIDKANKKIALPSMFRKGRSR